LTEVLQQRADLFPYLLHERESADPIQVCNTWMVLIPSLRCFCLMSNYIELNF
jgi:hypothetical protein